MTIIFYDIPSATPESAWSPNTWKTRFCLNFKGLPYKTEWVEYPDIEAHSIKLGIPPTSTKPGSGEPFYTLPAIYDPSTGLYLSDSFTIAEYLDKTYPDTPALFPGNSVALQAAFTSAFAATILSGTLIRRFILPASYSKLNPPSAEYFRRTREASFGRKIEEFAPTGEDAKTEWANFKKGLGKVGEWYDKNGPFLLGDTPSWADLVVAGYLVYLRIIWGEDSWQWKDISSWHGGRWGNLWTA